MPVDANRDSVLLALHGDGLDGGVIITDTAKSRLVTMTGNAVLSQSVKKFGNASIKLSAGSPYKVYAEKGNDLQFAGNYTWEGWFYFYGGALPTSGALFGWRTPTTSQSSVVLSISSAAGGSLFFGYGDSTGPFASSTGTLNLNTWHHLGLMRSGGTSYILRNGAVQAATTVNGSAQVGAVAGDFMIGGSEDVNGTTWANKFMDCYVDDVRISNIARYGTSTYSVPTETFGYWGIRGTVKVEGIPSVRNILVYSRASGALVDNFFSELDGSFFREFPVDPGEIYVIAKPAWLDAQGAKIMDRIQPLRTL